MAAASLDQAQVVAFALEHGTSAAARRFRVSDGYVRRLKRAAAPAPAPASVASARPGLRLVDAPSVPVSKLTGIQYAPAPQLVAAGRDFFKCPQCDELVKVAAGTRLVEWLAEQNAVHSHLSKAPAPAVMLAPAVSRAPEILSELLVNFEASQSAISSVVPAERMVPPELSSAGVVPVARVAPASSAYFVAVMAFVLPWLAEYWRFVLGVVLGLVIVCLCVAGIR